MVFGYLGATVLIDQFVKNFVNTDKKSDKMNSYKINECFAGKLLNAINLAARFILMCGGF